MFKRLSPMVIKRIFQAEVSPEKQIIGMSWLVRIEAWCPVGSPGVGNHALPSRVYSSVLQHEEEC